MFLRKEGFPEEGELVFCTVIKIQYHAVTVQLDEYDKPGLIPISEVSAGRIRNIRDFVEENKKIVCKVIRLDLERGHIDVSLRRVNESQRRSKLDLIKQEQKAEKIIEVLAEKLKTPVLELYKEIAGVLMKHYSLLYLAFEEVVEKNVSLEEFGLKKELAEKLEEIIKEKIKPKKVEIVSKISIQTYDEDGLELIKQAFAKVKELDQQVHVSYLGGGTYRLLLTAKDYKKAENLLEEIEKKMTDFIGKKGTVKFERQGE